MSADVRDLVEQMHEPALDAGRVLDGLVLLEGPGWFSLTAAVRAMPSPWLPGAARPIERWRARPAAAPEGSDEHLLALVAGALSGNGFQRAEALRALAHLPAPGRPEVSAAAAALGLLDHVPQVREAARAAVPTLSEVPTAQAALDVVLTGRARRHGTAALAHLEATLERDLPDWSRLLRASTRRAVHRWVFARAHERGELDEADLLQAVLHGDDQWVRTAAARWAARSGDPGQLAPLLQAPIAEARRTALAVLPETALSAQDLQRLLLDRAPIVREQARARARRRGLEVRALYRGVLADPAQPAWARAAALTELAGHGDERDVTAGVAALRDPSPRVRVAALTLLAGRLPHGQVPQALAPWLLDPAPRVAAHAARHVAALEPGARWAHAAWLSPRVSARRAALRVQRSAGGWERVVADLRAAVDVDPEMSGQGVAGVRTWLATEAATTWGRPGTQQGPQLAELLDRAPLPRGTRDLVAFHAGLRTPEHEPSPPAAAPDPAPGRRPRWWRRLLPGTTRRM